MRLRSVPTALPNLSSVACTTDDYIAQRDVVVPISTAEEQARCPVLPDRWAQLIGCSEPAARLHRRPECMRSRIDGRKH
jgi:hypothetical protein